MAFEGVIRDGWFMVMGLPECDWLVSIVFNLFLLNQAFCCSSASKEQPAG
jgi:hypothetical protein